MSSLETWRVSNYQIKQLCQRQLFTVWMFDASYKSLKSMDLNGNYSDIWLDRKWLLVELQSCKLGHPTIMWPKPCWSNYSFKQHWCWNPAARHWYISKQRKRCLQSSLGSSQGWASDIYWQYPPAQLFNRPLADIDTLIPPMPVSTIVCVENQSNSHHLSSQTRMKRRLVRLFETAACLGKKSLSPPSFGTHSIDQNWLPKECKSL